MIWRRWTHSKRMLIHAYNVDSEKTLCGRYTDERTAESDRPSTLQRLDGDSCERCYALALKQEEVF